MEDPLRTAACAPSSITCEMEEEPVAYGAHRTVIMRWRLLRSSAILAVCAIPSLVVFGPVLIGPAAASTYFIDCRTDNLQAAINASSPGATINVRGNCIGNFLIAQDITLNGPATLDGAGAGVVVSIFQPVAVTLSSLTIQDGSTVNGGGITNAGYGTLTLDRSSVTDNSGGGVYNDGTMTVANSSVTHNQGAGSGGIANVGALWVDDSKVSYNTNTDGSGGGITNAGTLTLDNSSVTNNVDSVSGGGGIDDLSGTVTIDNSSVTGNTAFAGGGIASFGNPIITINNSSVTKNSATYGGGIYEFNGSIGLDDTSVAHNVGTYGGGVDDLGGVISLNDSSVTHNTPDQCLGC